MATSQSLISTTRFLLVLITILCFLQSVHCTDFEVGEKTGWIVPPSNDTKFYNEWATHKRFKIGDTIRFKYMKDSVVEVNYTNYEECNSTRPNFFSNNGNTIYTLDRSGFFYFISGATGHCEIGQKLVAWVIGHDDDSSSGSGTGRSYAPRNSAMFSYGMAFLMFGFQLVYL